VTTRRTAKGALEPTGQSREGETPLPGSQQRILDAAVEAFAEQGYSGTATSEIARRAGVAEGTIFRYYPTKKAQEIAFHAELRAQFRHTIAAAIHPLLVRAIERMRERALIAPMAPSSVARIIHGSSSPG
jgi:AcrR family transcriptional regulator